MTNMPYLICRRDLSEATLRFDLAPGTRRRHAPKVVKNKMLSQMSSARGLGRGEYEPSGYVPEHARRRTPTGPVTIRRDVNLRLAETFPMLPSASV